MSMMGYGIKIGVKKWPEKARKIKLQVGKNISNRKELR